MNLDPNASRLLQMASRRAAQFAQVNPSAPKGDPKDLQVKPTVWKFHDEPCLECGNPATTKFWDEEANSAVSYWCDTHFDMHWLTTTVRGMTKSGEIDHPSQAYVPNTNYKTEEDLLSMEEIEAQLLGWPTN